MGVQEVVARFNKTKTSLRKKPNVPVPPLPNKYANDAIKQLPPSPIPSPVSSINHTNNLGKSLFDSDSESSSLNGITSLLQKFEQPSSKLPTPPESPVITLKNNKQQKPANETLATQNSSLVNSTIQEIEDLFQELVDQNNASEKYIQSLQLKVEKFASAATKVRDYEIRVEYLVTKLEQVTEERDFFEDQLNQASLQNTHRKPPSEEKEPADALAEAQEQQSDADHLNELLGVYEEISGPEEDANLAIQLYEQYDTTQDDDALNDRLVQADKGVQMTLMKYMTDLEKQKLETKALKEVVKKQDELISKLEQKIQSVTENPEELLKEQVEVQRIELENKRELLAQLLNEREELLKRLDTPRNSIRKSALEFLNNRSSLRPNSYCSINSASGRGTPPLTAPPKQPLPPLPNVA